MHELKQRKRKGTTFKDIREASLVFSNRCFMEKLLRKRTNKGASQLKGSKKNHRR